MKKTVLLFYIVLLSSCEDFVTVGLPDQQVGSEAVFGNDNTALAASNAMYNAMLKTSGFAGGISNNFTLMAAHSADEVMDYRNADPYRALYRNELTAVNTFVQSLWSTAYNTIYESNAVLEGLAASTTVSDTLRVQLVGEAYFVRAFAHFYLVNAYGRVPVVTTTDYRMNAVASRAAEEDVYEQITADLEQARELLTNAYFLSGRARPNRTAATALLARVHLYRERYALAESLASEVLSTPGYLLEAPANVFLKQSAEAIWQLPQTIPSSFPTGDAAVFYIRSGTFQNAMTVSLYNAFEPGDARLAAWVNTFTNTSGSYRYAAKYKEARAINNLSHTEHLIPLRFAEQYLIRAEARVHLENPEGAIEDLDIIRARATLPLIANTNADATQEELLLLIEQERRIELFCEMGHRWLDLKRTGRADAVLTGVKADWSSTDVLYPVPETELLRNPGLEPQNDGY